MQKKTIHVSISDWYQKEYPDGLEPFYGLLAHHLKECGKFKEAGTQSPDLFE